MIYHIYWGTSGNSGLYLDEIHECLKESGYKQKVFVSYHFPFNYGEKIFFKYSDLSISKLNGIYRSLIQIIEICYAFTVILIRSFKDKPKIINYSHIGNSYFFIYYFLRILKKISKSRLVVTCHDVNPHVIIKGEIRYRGLIFSLADYLLVHNENSILELKSNFGISDDKIKSHFFPLMDFSKIFPISNFPIEYDFVFVGHMRENKGINFLLEVWKEFNLKYPDSKLGIFGSNTLNLKFDIETLKMCNVNFQLKYLSDFDYLKSILSAKYIILPYFEGTNSGVISTVVSLKKGLIVSDIPMFKNSYFVSDSDIFENKKKISLFNILEKKYMNKDYSSTLFDHDNYKIIFKKSVNECYNNLLN